MTNYAQARISNPSRYFKTPGHVLSDIKLSHVDKVNVLKSMAVDADQELEATSEGMAGPNPSYTATELQFALVHLENVKDVEGLGTTNVKIARFQHIMVVITDHQHLNSEIVGVAFDLAEKMGVKICLFSVLPFPKEKAGLKVVGPTMTAVPFVVTDDAQIIEGRRNQLEELKSACCSSVETEIEVRSGQIEESIVAYAGECEADLIIVGSPNRSWLEALIGTSVARQDKSLALCPVLVIPEPA